MSMNVADEVASIAEDQWMRRLRYMKFETSCKIQTCVECGKGCSEPCSEIKECIDSHVRRMMRRVSRCN